MGTPLEVRCVDCNRGVPGDPGHWYRCTCGASVCARCATRMLADGPTIDAVVIYDGDDPEALEANLARIGIRAAEPFEGMPDDIALILVVSETEGLPIVAAGPAWEDVVKALDEGALLEAIARQHEIDKRKSAQPSDPSDT